MFAYPQTSTLVVICAVYFLSWPASFQAVELEYKLERIEQIGGEHLFNSSAIRIRKYNHTLAVLNGTAILYEDIDDSYEGSLRLAYSSLGNNQFNEYPLKVARRKICQLINEEYSNYQYIWLNYSNLPYIEKGTTYCPFPKGEYWVKNFAGDSSWIPPVIPDGLWRGTAELWDRDGKLVAQLLTFITSHKNYFKG